MKITGIGYARDKRGMRAGGDAAGETKKDLKKVQKTY